MCIYIYYIFDIYVINNFVIYTFVKHICFIYIYGYKEFYTHILSSMENYDQCYWASDLPSARATDTFTRQLGEQGHAHLLPCSPHLYSSFLS